MAPSVVAFIIAAFAISLSPNENKKKNEIKFDRMIDDLTLSLETIECISDARHRVLFRGIAAAVAEPQVRNAFNIIYRDLAPIRVAGDLLFGQLSTVAIEALERDDELLETIDHTNLAKTRAFFDVIDDDNSGGIDRFELLESPELLALIGLDIDSSRDIETNVDRFMALADENGDGTISFAEFANAVVSHPQFQLVDDALTAALLSSSSVLSTKKRGSVFGLRKSPEERFDAMLNQCLLWEECLGCSPNKITNANMGEECAVDVQLLELQQKDDKKEDDDDDGRLLQVLKGSLIGARCKPLVEALKMCYLEYSPLRLGGDIIFKLLKQVVKTQFPK